jgi:hypothetical protein
MRDYKGKNWTDDDVVGRGKEEKAVGFVCKSQWIKYGIRRKRKGKSPLRILFSVQMSFLVDIIAALRMLKNRFHSELSA